MMADQGHDDSVGNVGTTSSHHDKGIQRSLGITRDEERIIQSHSSRGLRHDGAHVKSMEITLGSATFL